jgi:hypothetical protein
MIKTPLILLFLAAPALANDTLINMPADTWLEIPNSRLDQSPVAVTQDPYYNTQIVPDPDGDPLTRETIYSHILRGNSGFRSVTFAWSGGAYDPDHHKMLIWGGGHQDYYGNEVYAFNLQTTAWERLTDPTIAGSLGNREVLDDGRPVSRHTYDGLSYSTHTHRMFAYGGSRSRDGSGTPASWSFDPAAGTWQHLNVRWDGATANDQLDGQCCGYDSEYDPVSQQVFMRSHSTLHAYDARSNTWSEPLQQNQPNGWGSQKGVVDTSRSLYFSIGRGGYLVYDIANRRDVTSSWPMAGVENVVGTPQSLIYGPGAAYDSKADKIVAWVGGGPWVMDMGSRTWEQKSGVGAPSVPDGQDRTTYSRFRYVPEYNVFILINSTTQNVYFYKHTAGGGGNPSPTSLPFRPRRLRAR